PFANTSLALECYTRRAGLFWVMAKGAFRRRRKDEPPSVPDLFARGEVVLHLHPRRERAILREWTLEEMRWGLRRDYDAFRAASGCAALVSALSRDGDRSGELFGFLDRALGELDEGASARQSLWAFALRVLSRAGFLAPLDSCASCGTAFAPARGEAVGFSPEAGGLVCERCQQGSAGEEGRGGDPAERAPTFLALPRALPGGGRRGAVPGELALGVGHTAQGLPARLGVAGKGSEGPGRAHARAADAGALAGVKNGIHRQGAGSAKKVQARVKAGKGAQSMTTRTQSGSRAWRPWRLGGRGLSPALAALVFATSCVYTFESALPAHIRTVRVEVFANATGYPGVEAELAKALVREFQVDGTVVPGSRYADSVLRGRLVFVGRSVVQEDAYDDVVTGQLSLGAVVSLEDASSGEELLSNEQVTSRDVRSSEGVYRMQLGETEAEARADAVTELARNIVRRVVEVW
ncbi:MAG: DNA repair protein RecO, partial [Planctomycetota bacterium]